jgi:cobyrinic acid a,c-diamide synthase
MALGRFIDTIEGERFPMAGVLPFGTSMLPRRKALGYTEVVLERECLLGNPGAHIRGHEFHYSEITGLEEAQGIKFAYGLRGRKYEAGRPEGYQAGSVLASYVHLHWGSAPEAAYNFVARCVEWNNRRPTRICPP